MLTAVVIIITPLLLVYCFFIVCKWHWEETHRKWGLGKPIDPRTFAEKQANVEPGGYISSIPETFRSEHSQRESTESQKERLKKYHQEYLPLLRRWEAQKPEVYFWVWFGSVIKKVFRLQMKTDRV
jgi:hypothetical protein